MNSIQAHKLDSTSIRFAHQHGYAALVGVLLRQEADARDAGDRHLANYLAAQRRAAMQRVRGEVVA